MASSIAENAGKVLEFIYEKPAEEVEGEAISKALQLSPQEVNDAVAILHANGYLEWERFIGTHPYNFGYVEVTARGRFEYERVTQLAHETKASIAATSNSPLNTVTIAAPPAPVGSPYGFEDEDWEIVSERKGARNRLNVVLGFQFVSAHYDSEQLASNTQSMFETAVSSYNQLPGSEQTTLSFRKLSAGYGEHLFNEIARDIISADIAVFETSDLNPNVMLELGVALTWGVRVFVIKKVGCVQPPSDLSGQTWADHTESAGSFLESTHSEKLVRMVERAIRKKSRT